MSLLQDDDPIEPARPATAGHSWRERFHASLNARMDPNAVLEALAERLKDDPVGVFKAIASTLPKEVDIRTEPQTHHLILLRLVGQAQERGVDLAALLEAPPSTPPTLTIEADASTELPEWMR